MGKSLMVTHMDKMIAVIEKVYAYIDYVEGNIETDSMPLTYEEWEDQGIQ